MKKVILSILAIILVSSVSYSAVKVNLSLSGAGLESGVWKIDVMATVLTGQVWNVGSSNIRVNWTTTPTANGVSVLRDYHCVGANTNLCCPPGGTNTNYDTMTTTHITSGGDAVSLNVVKLGAAYVLTPGTYKIGEIRFNRLDTTTTICLVIRTTSVMQDNLTAMTYGTDWTCTNPPACIRIDYLTGVNNPQLDLPTVFKLYDNYPNPFNPATTIKYDVPRNSFVKITIFDILGKLVGTPVNEQKSVGRYEYNWNASNYASGTYFYKMETDAYTNIKKMVLIK